MVGLSDVAPTAGSAIAATARDIIIRPGPRLVWVPHVQVVTVVVVPDKRQANIKRSEVDAISSGWEGRKNNGGECGNSKDNADRPHDLEPYEALKDSVRIPLNVAFVPLVPMDARWAPSVGAVPWGVIARNLESALAGQHSGPLMWHRDI